MRAIWLMALLLGVTVAPAHAAPMGQSETRTNVVYGMYSGLALLMDIRRPAKPNGFAVLNIRGSGFQAPLVWDAPELKSSDAHSPIEDALLTAGFTLITINHRAAPRFRYPAALEDAQRAARFVRQHADEFGVQPSKLAVFGASSGAYLAAMLGTVGEGSDAPPAGLAQRPACVVAAFAPSNLTPLGLSGDGVGYTVSFMGHPPAYPQMGDYDKRSFASDYEEASPINHVSAAASPMLLLHGEKDPLVPIDQSVQFAAALKRAGADVEFIRMPDVGHYLPKAYALQAVAWLNTCMGLK